MTDRKSAHLVERAAERLLRAGALEGSAAQLLEPGHEQPAAPILPRSDPPPPADTTALLAPEAPLPENLSDLAPAPETQQPTAPAVSAATLRKAGMFDWSGGRSRISEEFRLALRPVLATAFRADAVAGVSNIVLVTSAKPGEGKSFSALNLAGSAALQGDHRVLLIDGDPKLASLCDGLGLADAPGLLDLAADPKLDPDKVIRRTEIERLSVLPIGQERARSSELFAGREMAELIRRLSRQYTDRLLILDAAPCLSTSDPSAMAAIAGQIVFVVEAERTQRAEIEAALDLVQACPHIMLLLNKMQMTARHTFGAYSSYYSS
ncbi:MAG TPA: hypothetical protein VFL55_17940 [Acetobacteraceae bacterium]|nr:hypothetical protein [Acetobacteraceae bacterium]